MDRRVLFAALSVLLPVALWHNALYRRAGAYLLLDGAAPASHVALIHAAAALAAGAWTLRARHLPPWRAPWLLALFGAGAAACMVGAFFAFGSARWSAPFAFVMSASLGALAGALAAALGRTLAALAFPREQLLDLLLVRRLAVALALAVGFLLGSERLGPLRSGLLLALGCCLTAHLGLALLAPGARASMWGRRAAAWASYLLAFMQLLVEPLTPLLEAGRVPDPVVFARNEAHSRLVLTSGRGAYQLYVDAILRFSTIDAHRRREATVHPAMLAAPSRRRVLLLGGGDGGALREILRYPDVEQVTLVEPDSILLDVADQPVLRRESDHALGSPRARVVRADPARFLAEPAPPHDVVIIDLLEPEGPRRAKWFTRDFYRNLGPHLADNGVGAVATGASPLAQRRAFWCVVATLEAAGWKTLPYRANLPTMGSWGHVLFSKKDLLPPSLPPPAGLLYLDAPAVADLFALSPDEQRVDVEVNLLYHQILQKYRAEGG